MSILELLGIKKTGAANEPMSARTETVHKIAAELGNLPSTEAEYIAAFAYILSRVAHADQHVCDSEAEVMRRIVMERAGLSDDQASIVIEMAKNQALLFGGTENFLVTQEFNVIATKQQKIALLHCLYAVCVADHSISAAEDHEIRRIAEELLFYHSEFIEVRSSYAEHLDLLKKPTD